MTKESYDSIYVSMSQEKYTVEPLLTHTPRWTARAMGYERLWANRGMVKFEF